MKSIERITDSEVISSILKNDYDTVTFDGCSVFEDFIPDLENTLWFKLLYNEYTAGLIKLENLNWVTWMPHIIIKAEFRGAGSEQWGLLVAKYMKEIFKDIVFLVMTPYENAKRYAERMGFKNIGILPSSLKKNGILMDQYMLSLNGEEL